MMEGGRTGNSVGQTWTTVEVRWVRSVTHILGGLIEELVECVDVLLHGLLLRQALHLLPGIPEEEDTVVRWVRIGFCRARNELTTVYFYWRKVDRRTLKNFHG